MKKTILATAVAGVFGMVATGAQAATVYNQDDTKLDVYGSIEVGASSVNNRAGDSEDELFDNGSTIGFAGEHVINPALVGYFQAEFEFETDENKGGSGGINSGDNAFVGMKGDFGDFRIGSWDSLMNDWVQDAVGFDEFFAVSSDTDNSDSNFTEGNKVTYTSPSFGGLQFAVGTNIVGDGESDAGDAISGNIAFVDGTQGQIRKADDGNASFFGGLRYMVSDWTFAAVYDDLSNYEFVNTTTNINGDVVDGQTEDYGKQYGVSAGWDVTDALYLGAKWEEFEGDYADNTDKSYYSVGAAVDYGYGSIWGAYQRVEAEANATTFIELGEDLIALGTTSTSDRDYNEFMLGASYEISSQMYVWVEGALYDRDEDAADGVATGLVYEF